MIGKEQTQLEDFAGEIKHTWLCINPPEFSDLPQ